MGRKYEYALFDLDGTLVDSQEGIENCLRYALEKMEIPLPAGGSLKRYIGPPLHESFAELIPNSTPERVTHAVALYRKRYQREGIYEATVFDGIPDLLTQLHEQGWELYVATSKPAEYARQIVSHFSLNRFFRRVHGSQPDGTLARKEKLLRHVLKKESIFHGEAVMIGDRLHDVLGAKINYVKTVGVTYGFGSREELETAGADWICDSPAEIMETLATLNEPVT